MSVEHIGSSTPGSSIVSPPASPLSPSSPVAAGGLADGAPLLDREVRCEYPSKFCNNHKASKQKGGLHKFCEFHRKKANLNQKRWQQRRRALKQQLTSNGNGNSGPRGGGLGLVGEPTGSLRGASAMKSPTMDPKAAAAVAPIKDPVDSGVRTAGPLETGTPGGDPFHVGAPPMHFTPSLDPITVPMAADELDALTYMLFEEPTPRAAASYGWPPAMKQHPQQQQQHLQQTPHNQQHVAAMYHHPHAGYQVVSGYSGYYHNAPAIVRPAAPSNAPGPNGIAIV